MAVADTIGRPPRATSYDVARLAQVAQSTVSRSFRGDAAISPTTRQRVRDAAERLGYVPNTLARSLITRQSNMVGVVVTRATLRLNPDVVYAMGDALTGAGKQLLLITVESDLPPATALRGAFEYPLDGLICCVLLAPATTAELVRRQVPVVFYNRTPLEFAIDGVTADHAQAAANLADRLHAAGHRHFLCVGGPPDAPVSQQRLQGFLSRVPGAAVRHTDYSYAGGRVALLDHFQAAARLDAVFCANDQIAMGVMDAARYDLKLDIPRRLSVAGFDDAAEAARQPYDLTTIRQPSEAMAQEAIRLLFLRIARPEGPPLHSVLRSMLVLRGSARLRHADVMG